MKTIVVLTDGENTVDGVTLNQAIAACRQADISVHVVGFEWPELGQPALRRIATGPQGELHLASAPSACAEALKSVTQRLAVPTYRLIVLDTADQNGGLEIMVGGEGGQRLQVDPNAKSVSQMKVQAKPSPN